MKRVELNAEGFLGLLFPRSSVKVKRLIEWIRDKQLAGERVLFRDAAFFVFGSGKNERVVLGMFSRFCAPLFATGVLALVVEGKDKERKVFIVLSYSSFRGELDRLDRSMRNLMEKR